MANDQYLDCFVHSYMYQILVSRIEIIIIIHKKSCGVSCINGIVWDFSIIIIFVHVVDIFSVLLHLYWIQY